jgi:hypothetical protein
VNITRGYRIRVYPSGAQRRLLDCWFGVVRWLWNTTLEIRSAAYRECGLTITGNDFSRWLTQWKRTRYPRFKRNQHSGRLRFQGMAASWTRGIVSLPKLGPMKLVEAIPQVERPGVGIAPVRNRRRFDSSAVKMFWFMCSCDPEP